jgi:3-hydroxybutyryl-CoA dehydrogenase
VSASEASSGRPVAVIGAGTLGRRIALMFSSRGGVVRVCDLSEGQRADAAAYIDKQLPAVVQALDSGTPAEIEFTAALDHAVSDAWLVIESLPERLDLKRTIFGQLDRLAPADAILATNSSSFPSSRVIGEVTRPERVLNMHFFMPPTVTALELMSCGHTEQGVLERLLKVLPEYGLTPFQVKRESMGFIHNRIWAAIKREALAVVAEGVAEPADVDRLFAMVMRTPSGPFRMMDRVGLDVVLDIENNYAAARPGLPEGPRELLQRYIDDGRLGVESGRGFYDDYGQPARSP